MSDPPHIWDALRAVHSPKTLVDIINTLTNIPSETPERWIIVKSFFSKRVSSLAHLADMEWMKLVNLLSHSATSANAKQLHLDYYEFAATAHAGTDASTNLTHVPFSVLFPPVYTCSECGGNLFNYAKNSAVEVACYSFENGSHPASAYTLTCKSKTCKATHMYSYWKSSAGKLTYYEGQGERPYFQSSGDTFFSTQLLQHTHQMVVSANASFTAISEAYNETQNAFTNLGVGACPAEYNPRFQLNTKRLTEPCFRWQFVRHMEKAGTLPRLSLTLF